MRLGEGDALLLAARELDTPLADLGVVPLGQALDEVVGVGRTCRRHDLLGGEGRLAVGDVLRHRAREPAPALFTKPLRGPLEAAVSHLVVH
jgi:hypothetical protein